MCFSNLVHQGNSGYFNAITFNVDFLWLLGFPNHQLIDILLCHLVIWQGLVNVCIHTCCMDNIYSVLRGSSLEKVNQSCDFS